MIGSGEVRGVFAIQDRAVAIIKAIGSPINAAAAKAITEACSLDRLNALCAPIAGAIAASKPPEWADRIALPRFKTLKGNNHG